MIKKEFQFLNRLSDINNNTGIKFLHRAASPGSHCPMHMALATIGNIAGVSSLVVGMAECGYYSRFVARSPYGKNGELHYVYVLDKNEVVFGCRQGVMDALLQMGKEGAEVIVVILTCIPALIGEDMEAIIQELESMMTTKVVFIDGAHFKRNGYQSGLSNTLEQLIGIIDRNPVKDNKSINIFGVARGEEYLLLKGIIKDKGYKINEYIHGFSMEDLHHTVEASLSIVFNSKMLKAAKALQRQGGIPYVSLAGSYIPSEIAESYNEISKMLSFEESELKQLLSSKELLEVSVKEMKEKTSPASFIATYPELNTLPVTMLLCEAGMIPDLLHIEEFDEESSYYKEKILEKGQDPYIAYITNEEKTIEAFEVPLSMISLGNCKGLGKEHIIPNMDLARISSLCGFERSQALLNAVKNIVQNKEEVTYGTL